MIKIMEARRLKLGILASGRGSNFEAISNAIGRKELNADISLVISDKKDAKVLEKAQDQQIDTYSFNPREFNTKEEHESQLLEKFQEYDIDILVLAGYMRMLGKTILSVYKNRVVNIHPALLPAFPGLDAQKQALDYGVKYSGCTVHLVDEGMDTGPIILQAVVPILEGDTEDKLAQRILAEEHQAYWQALQYLAEGKLYLVGRTVYIKEDLLV